MVTDFYQNCLREIASTQISYIRNIGSGCCDSIESYRRLCGKVQGLEEAREILKTVYENIHSISSKNKQKKHEEEA